jgi:C4-dicarboxylate-specific signal transduction histidine kinase
MNRSRSSRPLVVNLLTNARDALATVLCKVISITCDLKTELVKIRVCDTGPSIQAELERRIFDPFFSTRVVNGGIGLGVSHYLWNHQRAPGNDSR